MWQDLENKKKLKVGCLSWTYRDWLGSFYPKEARSSDYLSLYSRVFDIVEVDSTFYHTPTISTVKQWKEKTPEGFLFTVKVPKKITHIAKLKNVEEDVSRFEKSLETLGPKLACAVLQLPPSLSFDSGFDSLRSLLTHSTLRYAVEVRHPSWLRNEMYELLKERKACFIWSENEYLETVSSNFLSTSFVYLRLRGEFNEFTRFDHVQKDRTDVLESCWEKLSALLDQVSQAYVMISNHFSGFAPATANQFRKIAGLGEVDWEKKMDFRELI